MFILQTFCVLKLTLIPLTIFGSLKTNFREISANLFLPTWYWKSWGAEHPWFYFAFLILAFCPNPPWLVLPQPHEYLEIMEILRHQIEIGRKCAKHFHYPLALSHFRNIIPCLTLRTLYRSIASSVYYVIHSFVSKIELQCRNKHLFMCSFIWILTWLWTASQGEGTLGFPGWPQWLKPIQLESLGGYNITHKLSSGEMLADCPAVFLRFVYLHNK